MDDLSTLDWPSQTETKGKAQPYKLSSPSFAALRPTPPTSGRSSPFPITSSKVPSKLQTPANDSFSNLVSFSSASTNENLSLQEQQKRLLEQKAQQQAAKQKQIDYHYGGSDKKFWDNLGSGRSTLTTLVPPSTVSDTQSLNYSGDPVRNGTTDAVLPQPDTEDEDDLLAAFKADAPVDSASYFPKPSEQSMAPGDAGQENKSAVLIGVDTGGGTGSHDLSVFDDDDPFELRELPTQPPSKPLGTTSHADDEDVLGLLGKPVTDTVRPLKAVEPSAMPSERNSVNLQDHALAELVEMGFPAARAKEALQSTDSGVDIPQAVSWLLNKAHSDSSGKARSRQSSNGSPRQNRDPRVDRKAGSRPASRQPEESEPAWSNGQHSERNRHQGSDLPPNDQEKDLAPMTSELGTAFLKTAGSLWKTSTKKVQQAVQELNSDSDSGQPKWMRERGMSKTGQKSDHNGGERGTARSRRRISTNVKLESVTDEAMMLESDRARPPPRKPPRRREPALDISAGSSRDHSPAVPSRLRQESPAQPAFLHPQQPKPQQRSDTISALNRQAIDDQASQAYVSSARRPALRSPVLTSEVDLLEGASQVEPSFTSRPATTQDQLSQPFPPVAVRPPTTSRTIPQVPAISLKASHAEREAGNSHFKRGDYPAAHQSYTSSLKYLPASHPITVILHTNRALTALKIGEPGTAISECEVAITVIGPKRGEGETIDLSNGELPKLMREYFGKALMRKAEALEQMERWKEAASVWKEAVEGGHGGSTSIQGRIRCKKAAAPQQPKQAKPAPAKKPNARAPIPPAISGLNGASSGKASAAAVKRLRDANAAADKVDDEKFALADLVDAKLSAWKGGKADNLRALLGSLDTVLWPEAGWKKIGMAELVLPTKVKVQYMKGIAKVHPDKVRCLSNGIPPAGPV